MKIRACVCLCVWVVVLVQSARSSRSRWRNGRILLVPPKGSKTHHHIGGKMLNNSKDFATKRERERERAIAQSFHISIFVYFLFLSFAFIPLLTMFPLSPFFALASRGKYILFLPESGWYQCRKERRPETSK